MKRNHIKLTATAVGAAGVMGLTAIALPTGAGADPELPPIPPEKLVESVLAAGPIPLSGTVRVDNALGLPPLPIGGEHSQFLSNGTEDFRVWADGEGRQRLAMPSDGGEKTVVNDGSSVWKWDSTKRAATRTETPSGEHRRPPADPAGAARHVVDELRRSSDVAVDGTSRVAGRDAYELVLTPKQTERTLLREVRVAVDAQNRTPLNLAVETRGNSGPALQVGYTKLDTAPPDPNLFRFTPPEGAKVEQVPAHHGPVQNHGPPQNHGQAQEPAQDQHPEVVGDGWDAVVVGRLPARSEPAQSEPHSQHGRNSQDDREMDPRALAEQVGKKIHGPWGEGWVVNTQAGSAMLTADGRVAVGAVPEKELTSAIEQS